MPHEFSVGSLFSGIGGIDLGLERAGWKVKWQIENDPFCRLVLKKHWPNIRQYGNIKRVKRLDPVDLVCGGFPCQPVSVAGRRKGQKDKRWLWPEFARILGLVRPRFVLVENTPGLLSLGMGEVLGDLALLGYDAEWHCIPAAAAGAPHLRYRVFIVGYAKRSRLGRFQRRRPRPIIADRCEAVADTEGEPNWDDCTEFGSPTREEHASCDAGLAGGTEDVANAALGSARCETDGSLEGNGSPRPSGGCGGDCGDDADTDGAGLPFGIFPALGSPAWESEFERLRELGGKWWSAECRLGLHPDGLSAGLDCGGWECRIPRVTRKQANREARLRALGNAVVPQIPEWLGVRLGEILEKVFEV